ncbi:hypothetical protein C3K47_02110 [Solitalea longa]|uniref:Ricin B lectin domain-containing protein n=1 Tax=Solitalea longa TaxID=2079460 RepID=A0A2S5A9X1_9SPHI|nr:hypothetical protein [Solitalea longa]POY39314.1 hypothetical protein C3K47_02110 [Solitalea longa]
MKTIYQITLCTLLLHWAVPSEAQLLSKLKNKANQQINKAVLGDNTTVTGNAGSGSGPTGSSGNESSSDRLSDVEKEEIYKLEEDEHIDYRESFMMINSANKLSGLVIVNRNGKRFVVQNGIKTGPYSSKDVPLGFWKEAERNTKEAYSTDPNEMLNVYKNYIKSDADKDYILFNGKKSISFSTLEAMKVNPEKTKYIALVAIEIDDNNKQKFLINQDGKKVEVAAKGQVIGQMIVNATFTDAAFWGQDLSAIDYSNGSGMKTVLATLSGIKQVTEPPLTSVWFADNGHLLASNGKAIYLNGKVLKVENDLSVGTDWRDIWLNKDGTAWAALLDNKLVFSDGNKVTDGFSISSSTQNGKTVLRWIAVSKGSLSITRYAKTL